MNEFKLKLKPEEITLLNITKEISWWSAHVGLPDVIEVTPEQYSAIADLFVDGKPTKLEGVPIKITGSKPNYLFNKYFSKCGLIGELPEKKFNRPTLEEVIIWDLKFNRTLTHNIWRVLHGLKPLNPKLSNIKHTSFKTFDWNDFWCKASWFVVGCMVTLITVMLLVWLE